MIRSGIGTGRSGISRSLLAAALVALGAAAPAPAQAPVPPQQQWEAPQRVDNEAAGFLSVTSGDVAVGANGLASIVFSQARDSQSAVPPYGVRRPAGAAEWTDPLEIPLPDDLVSAGAHVLSAAADGSVRGVFNSTGLRGLAWAPDGPPRASARPGIPSPSAAAVASDPAGNAYAVAVSEGKIMYAEFVRGDGWGSPVELAAAGAEPSIAASPGGDVAVAYSRTGSGGSSEVVVRRKRAADDDFSAEEQGILAASPADQPAVAYGADLAITVAYRLVGSSPLQPSRIQAIRWLGDAAQPSSSAAEVSGTDPRTGPADLPQIVVDPASQVTVAWNQQPPPSGRNLVSSERINGVFSAPQLISAIGNSAFDIDVDVQGTATAVFIEGSGATAAVSAARRATGGAWTAKTRISPAGGAVRCSGSTCFPPKVAAEAAGQVDTFFIMTFGTAPNTQDRAFSTRFTGPPPGGGPVVAEAEGCPVGYNKVSGGEGDDSLAGTEGPDAMFGRGGNDRLSPLGGPDCVRGGEGNDDSGGGDGDDELSGEGGDDNLRGDDGRDSVLGGEGNDLVAGGSGGDALVGGNGDDRLSGATGDDGIDGGPGTDRIFAGEGNDAVSGGDNNDLISGSSGNDLLLGNDGADRINGGPGRNRLEGGAGADRLRGGASTDTLLGGPGTNTLFGLSGRDLMIGGEGIDIMKGGDANDRLAGRDGNDRLRGGGGNDRISGGSGDDRLWGDGGRDRIGAGAGDDLVHAADRRVDTINCGRGRDRVTADANDRVSKNCERVRIRRSRRR